MIISSEQKLYASKLTAGGPSAQKHGGSTIIELLIVIAIIAILIAVLLPTIIGARRAANQVKCLSNLHQLGIAAIAYATDNKGRFPYRDPLGYPPPEYYLASGFADERRLWVGYISGYKYDPTVPVTTVNYDKNDPTRIFYCPFTSGTTLDYGASWPLVGSSTYLVGYEYMVTYNSDVNLSVFTGHNTNISEASQTNSVSWNALSAAAPDMATGKWPRRYGPRILGDPGPLFSDIAQKETQNAPYYWLWVNHTKGAGGNANPADTQVLGVNMVLTDGSARFYSYPKQMDTLISQLSPITRNFWGGVYQP